MAEEGAGPPLRAQEEAAFENGVPGKLIVRAACSGGACAGAGAVGSSSSRSKQEPSP